MKEDTIPEALVGAVIRIHIGAWTEVKVGKYIHEEFDVSVLVHQVSVL